MNFSFATQSDLSDGIFRIRKSTGELAILALLGVLGTYVTIWSQLNLPAQNPLGGGAGPRVFPQVAGIVMMTLSVYLCIKTLWHRRRGTLDDETLEIPYRNLGRVTAFILLITTYMSLFTEIGFFITTIALLFVGFTLLGFRRYVISLPLSVFLTVAIYIVFNNLLNLPLPSPILEGILA